MITPEEKREYKRNWMREWRAKHPELAKQLAREFMRKSRLRHPERFRERSKKYAEMLMQKCPEKIKAWKKKWQMNNKEKRNFNEKQRRFRKKNAEGKFTLEQFKRLVTKVDNHCPACGYHFQNDATVDHIVPLIRCGSNEIENIQPLCLPCNSSKGTKIINYMELRESRGG